MTITVAPARSEYTANAGQTIFNYTFKIFENTDLNVYVTPAGQECSDSDLTTAYTVSGIGDPAGGSITLNTPTSDGDLVTIVSAIPSERTTDYQNNGDFRPDTVNEDIDRVVSIVKKLEDKVSRSPALPECFQGDKPLKIDIPKTGFSIMWDGNKFINYKPVPADYTGTDIIGNFTNYTASNVENAAAGILNSGFLIDYEVGMSVSTLGSDEVGDGGAASYLVVPGGTGPADNILYINTTNGLQLKLELLPQMNIRCFRAKLDGLSDDSLSFQTCADSNVTGYVDSDYYVFSDVSGGRFVSNKLVKNLSSGAVYVENLNLDTKTRKIEIIAHRGFDFIGTESTIPTFSKAARLGADWLEFDLNYSADGTIYVFHDETVDGITNGTGTFRQLSDSYIDTLKYKDNLGSKYESVRIPKLTEVLELASSQGIKIFPEIKYVWESSKIEELINLLDQYGFNNNRCILQAGFINYVEEMRSYSDTIALSYLGASATVSEAFPFIDRLARLGNGTILWNQGTAQNKIFVDYCRSRGVDVSAYTITNELQARDLVKNGVYKIVTDTPLKIGGVL